MNKERLPPRHRADEREPNKVGWSVKTGRILAAGAIGLMSLNNATVMHEQTVYDKGTVVEQLPDDDTSWLIEHKELKDSRPERMEEYKNASWVIIPGLNMSQKDSYNTAIALQPFLDETGEVAWTGYADQNKPMDMDVLTDKVMEYVHENNLESINLVGESFGGRISLDLAQRLSKLGIKIPAIIFDSSPMLSTDAYDQKGLELASSWLMVPIVYYTAKSTNQFTELNLKKNIADVRNDMFAVQNDPSRLSTSTVKGQALFISNMTMEGLKSVELPPETQLFYIGSKDDKTVDTDAALSHLRKGQPDKMVLKVSTDGSSHASPIGNKKEYKPAMETIVSILGPSPEPERAWTSF